MADFATRRKSAPCFCCSTPGKHCLSGAKGAGFHGTVEQVLKCEMHYHTAVLGRKRLGSREVETEFGILLLNRHPPRAKPGKTDNRWMNKGVLG